MKHYVSVDIGGTFIKYAVLDEDAVILFHNKRPTEAWKGGKSILGKVREIIEECLKEEQIDGICISTAGMVDVEKGEILYAASYLPDYAGTGIRKELEEAFHIPCEVENDVNCAGLAEAVSGAAKGADVSLTLTVGTGIGGCAVVNGRVFHGSFGSACEVGYMYLDGKSFQDQASVTALIRKVALIKNEKEEEWDGYRIIHEAEEGDPDCLRAFDEMVEALGKGIANICSVLDPEVVVLGGGIMEEEGFFGSRIEAAVKRWLVPGIAEHTRIRYAEHKNTAGLLGAFYHFRQRREGVLLPDPTCKK